MYMATYLFLFLVVVQYLLVNFKKLKVTGVYSEFFGCLEISNTKQEVQESPALGKYDEPGPEEYQVQWRLTFHIPATKSAISTSHSPSSPWTSLLHNIKTLFHLHCNIQAGWRKANCFIPEFLLLSFTVLTIYGSNQGQSFKWSSRSGRNG